MTEVLKTVKTKKGYDALWERGGGFSNTGNATIVCGKNGDKLKAVYVKKKGHLACGEHALVIIKDGYHIINAKHHRGDFEINIFVVRRGDDGKLYAIKKHEFSNNEWDDNPPEYLTAAIEAAKNKAQDYHCRTPYYVKDR